MEPADESSETAGGTTVEELERFRQDIERYRARRRAVSDEFDGFVQSFKKPTTATRPVAPPIVDTPPVTPPVVRSAPAAPPAVRSAPAPPPVVRPPSAAPPVARPVATSPPAATAPSVPPLARPAVQKTAAAPVLAPSSAGRRSPRAIAGLLLTALVILAAVGLWPRDRGPASDPVTQPSAAAPTTPPVASPTPTPATQPTPAAPDRSEAELRTTRAVWIRATADGTRIVNRELPAGATVPFRADRTIEIRTGDAGAVRLWIGGRDQGPLGRDGEVVTRSFTVPVR